MKSLSHCQCWGESKKSEHKKGTQHTQREQFENSWSRVTRVVLPPSWRISNPVLSISFWQLSRINHHHQQTTEGSSWKWAAATTTVAVADHRNALLHRAPQISARTPQRTLLLPKWKRLCGFYSKMNYWKHPRRRWKCCDEIPPPTARHRLVELAHVRSAKICLALKLMSRFHKFEDKVYEF